MNRPTRTALPPSPGSPATRLRVLQAACVLALAGGGILSASRTETSMTLASAAIGMVQPAWRPDAEASAPFGSAMGAAQAGLKSIEVVVRRNDTLDQIFRRLELSLNDLANLRAMQGLRAALDRLHPGEVLTLGHHDGMLMALSRRISPSEVLKVERSPDDGFVASVEETPLQRTQVTTRGTIRSSLFESASSAGLKDTTTLALAELFRWDVDFVLDLREGDEFSVTYERVLRDGEYIGDGAILAAEFVNQGHPYRAVRFVAPDGKADYYTPDGESLRKAFLKAPLDFSRVSSVFNLSRKHPILNTIRAHRGVDYAAPSGTPIRAAGDGRVRYKGVKSGFGNVLEIEHNGQVVTVYGHLSKFATGIANGAKVHQGQVVAYVGMTGLATGPHLHFEYRVRGEWKNPQVVLKTAEPAAPIEPALRADFERQSQSLLASLATPGAPAQGPAPAAPSASGPAFAATR